MTDRLEMNRRQFVVSTAAVGGGMALGLGLPAGRGALAAAGDVEINPWIVIGADSTVTVFVPSGDSGQGVMTMGPRFVCEELNCDWAKVKSDFASPTRMFVDKVYTGTFGNPKTTLKARDQLLQAGASARERLKAAAAQQWSVPVAEVEAKDSKLIHKPSGRTLGYGDVAAKAATIKLDKEPVIKPADQWTILGKSTGKLDTPKFVNGSAIYGLDIQLPGKLYAAVKLSPVHGGKVKSYNFDAIKDRPGVRKVVVVGGPGSLPPAPSWTPKFAFSNNAIDSAVAVIADHYWQAKSALDLLPIEWDEGSYAKFDTNDMTKSALADLTAPNAAVAVSRKDGDALGIINAAGSKALEATYETPYLEHATMEPLNGTALVTPDRLDLWISSQHRDGEMEAAAHQVGMPLAKSFIHGVFAGGGFGRRVYGDDARLVAAIAKEMPGTPIHSIWSREETTRHGLYRPMAYARMRGAIGADGMPSALYTRYITHAWTNPNTPTGAPPTGTVRVSQISDTPYAIPSMLIEYKSKQSPIRTGPWRAPSYNQNGFMIESFIDEMAEAAGKDPLDYRRALLAKWPDPGWLKCLNEVADKSGWGKRTLPKGTGQGIAIGAWSTTVPGECTINAQVATVSVSRSGAVKIDRVDVAVDPGNVMNPDGVAQAMEGGVVYGATAALFGEINVRNGRVVEGNFDDYQMMRIEDMPEIHTHFGGLTGGKKFLEVGESPMGPIFPAITSAIHKATGKRVRSFPLKNHDLSWS